MSRPLLSACLAAIVAVVPLFGPAPAFAAGLTPAEQLYADLAKLSPEARFAKLEAGARKGGVLNMIQTIRGKLGNDHMNIFRKRYPYLKFSTFEMGTMDASTRLLSEETAGRHLTDAVQVTFPDLPFLLEKDLLARYPTPATKKILKQYEPLLDAQNRWLPWQTEEHGIGYNPTMVKAADAPKSYDDLCDPKHRSQASYEPTETKFVVGLYYAYNQDMARVKKLIDCIGKNDPIVMRGHTVRLELMLAGDHAIQGDNFLYRGTLSNQKNPRKAPFKAVYEAPVMIYGGIVGINKNTPNPEAVALFADWTLSEESQDFFAKEYRGPVALPHPYIPDNAQLVVTGLLDSSVGNDLLDHWVKAVTKR